MTQPTSPSKTVAAADPAPKAAGLRGVEVADSSICHVDGVNGRLIYRGYDILDLAAHSTFEETTYLLIHGALPTREQLDGFARQLAAERALPEATVTLIEALPRDVQPMDALRTVISHIGTVDPDANDTSKEARDRVALRLVARTATAVAAIQRRREGKAIVPPTREGSHAASFLRMMRGEDPDDFDARAMDVALILHADHEFNASTFTARVAASTLSDTYSAITAAVCSLKGPLHGGANRAVMEQLEDIGSPEKVDAWVDAKFEAKEKVMGFGHAVYKTMDPRATVLKRWSHDAAERRGDTTWFRISETLEENVHGKKGLWPNVDFYSASLYRVMGVPLELYPCLFAISRVSGWLAHVHEQWATNKLIRPKSHYSGPQKRPYVPVAKRS